MPAHVDVSPPSHPQPRNSLKKQVRACLPPHAFPTPVNYSNTSLLFSPLSPTSSSETSPTRNSVTSCMSALLFNLRSKLINGRAGGIGGQLRADKRTGCLSMSWSRPISRIATTQPATRDSTPFFCWREVCMLARHEDTACLSLVRTCRLNGTSAENCTSGQTTYI